MSTSPTTTPWPHAPIPRHDPTNFAGMTAGRARQLFVPGGPRKSVVSWGKGRCGVGGTLLGGGVVVGGWVALGLGGGGCGGPSCTVDGTLGSAGGSTATGGAIAGARGGTGGGCGLAVMLDGATVLVVGTVTAI